MTDNQQDPEEPPPRKPAATERRPPSRKCPAPKTKTVQESPAQDASDGTEEQMSSENASATTGFDADAGRSEAAVPSTDAEMDASNTEKPDAGRPFSSEPGQDAAGLPDGSGTDLPEEKSPKDRNDDKEPSTPASPPAAAAAAAGSPGSDGGRTPAFGRCPASSSAGCCR